MSKVPTKQEVFDKAVAHLRSMKKRSIKVIDGNPRCLYRGPKGARCVMGAFIPDELYNENMEDQGASVVIDDTTGLQHLKSHSALLNVLQSIHDNADHWNRKGFNKAGEKALKNLAVDFQLKYTASGVGA